MEPAPDFIPDSEFRPDATPSAAPSASESPDFIPDNQFVSDHQKYGSLPQQALTGIEGAAQGFAGPGATLLEQAVSDSGIPGLTPQDRAGRQAAHPWTHGLTEAGGFGAGILTGTGEAGLLGKAGEAVTQGLKLGGEGASIGSRLAAGAARTATEMGLFQAGDEASKVINQDPNQTIGSVIQNVGLSTVLGGLGGGALSGLGMAAKGVVNSQVLSDFKDRLAFRGANVHPNELMEKEFNDAIEKYHAMNDELLGPQGLKAQALEKIMPKQMTPEISAQIQEVANKGQEAIQQMTKKDVPSRYVKKFMGDLNAFQEVATNPDATVGQNFDALNSFKQTLQGYSKGNFGPFAVPSYHEAYDFLNLTKGLGHDVRLALEDPKAWGEVADLQKTLNKSWTEVLPAVKDAQKKFMEKIGGEYVPSPQKFSTYVNQNGKSTSQTIRQKMMGNFVDALDQHFKTVDDLYETAGVENPHPAVSMNALQESLERPSLGSRLGDAWYDKIGPHALGNAAGAATGAAVAPGFEGAYLGKELLGPAFGSIIKPLLEKGASSQAFQSAMAYGKAAIKGDHELTNAAKNVFGGELKTLPSHIFAEVHHLEKLDRQLKAVAQNPTPLFNVAGDLGHYMPQHSQTVAKTAMNAANYLNAQRPSNPKTGPLDTEIPVSKAQTALFDRALSIAQKPLTVLQHIKDGTLLPQDVATLKTLYPGYYDKISQELMGAMTEHLSKDEAIPYRLRQSLSLFLGQPLDSTMTPSSIESIQTMFIQNKPVSQMQAQPQGKKGSPSKLGKISSMLETPTQSSMSELAKR